MVAAVLRERIVAGDMEPGESLPKQEDLLAEFRVSLPSLREAMRILESEGLITVRRGKTGGAIVHGPQADNAAQMLGLVLQSRQVQLKDLSIALRALEPACAVLCSKRSDRKQTVVEPLQRLHEESLTVMDDPVAFTKVARRFHEQMINACGNQTLILVVGALDHLWSSRDEIWDRYSKVDTKETERSVREQGAEDHKMVIDAIAEADGEKVQRVLYEHLQHSTYYQFEGEAAVRVV